MPETALLVIDMLNAYHHEDAEPLTESVEKALPAIVDLRDRAAGADDVLTVYVNDNYERWEAERADLVRQALAGARPDLVEPLVPDEGIPFVFKGRHSIFYETPLAHLLHTQEVKRVVLTGQVTEQCILYSALDGYLRGYELSIPRDAVAHIHGDLGEAALKMMERNMHADLTPAADGGGVNGRRR
jgi:nicotinamidase-related amidase